MSETIIQGNVLDEYKKDMQIYAIAVNRKQSVPDVRDGLKSVARKILTSAFIQEKLYYDGPYSKCAGLVGSTLKHYYAHGDAALYSVIVNLANWYSTKIPLLDGHGNFGDMEGSDAAAYRYTEIKLSEFGQECMIGDLAKSKDIVDWVPTFNDKELEPEYLPAKVPFLLINGTMGIGIGMKTEIPTHNLSEVIDATINLIKNPDAKVVLIPDHYMGCDIIDTNWKAISNTGQGTYRVRARIDIEQDEKRGNYYLHIRGIPNAVTMFKPKSNKEDQGVVSKIQKMMKDGQLPGVLDIYSNTKGNNLDYVIKLAKGVDPYFIKDFLYKNTLLENTYRVNFEVLNGIDIQRFSYKSYLEFFINFSINLKFRSYAALHQKAKTEWRTYQLYIMVMEDKKEFDKMMNEIRNLKDVSPESINVYKEKIIKRYNVTDIEADFILNMDVKKTAIGYLDIYKAKSKELENLYNKYFYNLTHEEVLLQELIDDLTYYKKKYGTPRLCRVIKDVGETIPQGEFKIVITENNYIKKLQLNDPINTYRGDNPKFTLKVDNTENILLYDKNGTVFKLPIYKIGLCAKNAPGFDIRQINKRCTSDIISVMYEPSVVAISKELRKSFLVVTTENGYIKKLDLDDFLNVPPSGIKFTKLSEGDSVKDIAIIPHDLDIILYSNRKALRFNMSEVPHYKRTAQGVIGMNTKDKIDGVSVIYPGAEFIVVITKLGKVNKFNISGMNVSKRAKAGSNVIKLSKQDSILNIYGLPSGTNIRGITKQGVKDICIDDIPLGSSVSAGTKVFSDIIKTIII